MRKYLAKILAVVTALMVLGACNIEPEDVPAGFSIYALNLHAPVDATQVPTFRFEPVTLSTVTDFKTLTSSYFRIRYGGQWEIVSIRGSIFMGEGFGGGEDPRLEYEVKDGVVVPLSYQSLVMMSAFRNFDLIFSQLEALTGVTPAALLQRRTAGQYTIWFEPRIDLRDEGTSSSVTAKLNAAFMPEQGQFLLFERSEIERVPLAANLQVVAHEFGHAVFDYLFFADTFSSDSPIGANYALSGVNEGFADFFSYLMTGSTNVLEASLGDLGAVDERNFGTVTFDYSYSAAALQTVCAGDFYCIGTLFAQSLYMAYKDLSDTDKATFRTLVFATLAGSRERIQNDLLHDGTSDGVDTSLLVFLADLGRTVYASNSVLGERLCAEIRASFPYVKSKAGWGMATCP